MKRMLLPFMMILGICFVGVFVFPSVSGAEETMIYATQTTDDQIKIENGQVILPTQTGDNKIENQTDAWNLLLKQANTFVLGLSGIATLALIGYFIINFMRMAAVAHDPRALADIKKSLLWVGIAAAGAGSVTMITTLFYNIL